MERNSKCGPSNLDVVIQEFLERVGNIIEGECLREASIDEVTEELKALTPLLRVVLSKWVPEIIYVLFIRGEASFNELKRALNVSSRVLSDKLGELKEKGIVVRDIDTQRKPPGVHYRLTKLGKELGLALIPLLLTIKRKLRQKTRSNRDGSKNT